MKQFFLLLVVGCLLTSVARASDPTQILDSNTAFYEGESYNYLLHNPNGFTMNSDEAVREGYSFAFVPQGQLYRKADVLIGVHIYKIRGISFETALLQDTLNMRQQFGKRLQINPVTSLRTGNGWALTGIYTDMAKRFFPQVMTAYCNGGTEMIILELVISPDAVRPKAEEKFMECLQGFKVMQRKELSKR